MVKLLALLLELVGAAAAVVGCALLAPALGWIVGGAALVLIAQTLPEDDDDVEGAPQ